MKNEIEAKGCACGGHDHHKEGAACSCEHCGGHGEEGLSARARIIFMASSAVLLAAGLLLPHDPPALRICVFAAAYLLVGWSVLREAGENILHGKVFDENFLMAIASLGAFAIGEYAEGVAVMLFYSVGEFFEDLAADRSRDAITALIDVAPDEATLVLPEGGTRTISAAELRAGDVYCVKAGDRLPADGVVIAGGCSLDTSALTGESVPRAARAGDAVLSGSMTADGYAEVRAAKPASESTAAKLLALIEDAADRKAPAEDFITKFARVYTPIVCGAALLLAVLPPLLTGTLDFGAWVYRALTFLVVSCPCALVISVPLGFFGGLGGASRVGVLIKGGSYIEVISKARAVVTDKTGTLTNGDFEVAEVCAKNGDAAELLRLAAHAEARATHPIAASIIRAYGQPIDAAAIESVSVVRGKGVSARIDGAEVLAGNAALLADAGLAAPPAKGAGAVVYIAKNGEYMGSIAIADSLKATAKDAVSELKSLAGRVVMLTGDSAAVAETVARELGIAEVRAELLPQDKVSALEGIMRETDGATLYIGDGLNDAPVLALADAGVAMGGIGSDAAIAAADVVIMNDDPRKLAACIRICRRTTRIVRENIVFALAVKVLVLALAATGIAGMWLAVFADVGVALLCVLNSVRAMRTGRRG